jgi:stage III sporulation protein AD
MEALTRAAALCLTGALLAALLKKRTPELAMLVAVAVCGVGVTILLGTLREVRAFLQQMLEWGGLAPELFVPLVKTLAIALISRLGADLCRDAGQSAMASVVEAVGAFAAVAVALPLFAAVWDMLRMMMQ